ncbi:type VI secretion system membrane subunit TssM [Massilia sp. TS11]|uniref:type VI secretion system membrane subunit TssM n=1 Tax=Massilia sp. TS11 TaxID=2908003 RepID=UPI001EDAB725|nr:type VI secretion system membrane subunit TssM [Massilia sp. TS11]MCG2584207.1 type VI secretion system membrane subunit TssM [Massilia sp. TS11]
MLAIKLANWNGCEDGFPIVHFLHIMRRFWQFCTDGRVLGGIVLTALVLAYVLADETWRLWLLTGIAALLVLLILVLVVFGARYVWRRQRGMRLRAAMAPAATVDKGAAEHEALRKQVLDAVDTIKTSRLGLSRGAAALYDLPWFMIIGNPAAGKSSAIAHSGLHFPITDSKALQGVGGTRNCDWFFTTEGILLDTAGRYAVSDSDRREWFTFLDLLKKQRPQAPINGILIAASLAELGQGQPQAATDLAKALRSRVQELTERLSVHAPVYVLFTKADLIPGFVDFFQDLEPAERERIWGATLRYNRRRSGGDVLAFFDQEFDLLCQGLKAMRVANISARKGPAQAPGVFSFPDEFAALRASLHSFLSILFDENAYQFRPIFRGFYVTSALQEGQAQPGQQRAVAERFGLNFVASAPVTAKTGGMFLRRLFREVIFADRELVRRYRSPARMRMRLAVLALVTLGFGSGLGVWSWSYMGNRAFLAGVRADLGKLRQWQAQRSDLQARLEALELLQDRIDQLADYRRARPLALSFGLYQGEEVDKGLRRAYYDGVRTIMLDPVVAQIEALLTEMSSNPERLGSAAPAERKRDETYASASAASAEDCYNALKAYLMLADPARAEAGHLTDQLTRFWRGWLEANRGSMPREQMIRIAERVVGYVASHADDAQWPRVAAKLALVDQARDSLRRVAQGRPAIDRVYADIKARAGTRFPSVSVASLLGEQDRGLLTGSAVVAGAFTRAAWQGYVAAAIKEAAGKDLQSTDWVLKTVNHNDLSLEGSPEQIQKNLSERYKADYIREWKAFLQGVSVADMRTFEASVSAINRLAEPQASPIARVLRAVAEQTRWDQPAAVSADKAKLERSLWAWFKDLVVRPELRTGVDAAMELGARADAQSGSVAREFAGVARLVSPLDKEASLLSGYLDSLARLRARLNQLKNQGDPGPGARQLMQQTLDGSGSELADALKYVDEQMLSGLQDGQKQSLRPLLVRPLMQTFAMLLGPSEAELNKIWQAQVLQPFERNLASKYPFAPKATLEASSAEIGQVFGPDGAIAKFVGASMASLVVRRGDQLSPRTWAEMGIQLSPLAQQGFPGWLAPLSNHGIAAPSTPTTVFQMLPQPSPGVSSFTLEIDGQQLQYKGGQAAWTSMVHPGAQGVPGARILAQTSDGRSVEILNEAGEFGLKRMIDAAVRTRKDNGVFGLQWQRQGAIVNVDLKVISNSEASASDSKGFLGLRLPDAVAGTAVQNVAGTP